MVITRNALPRGISKNFVARDIDSPQLRFFHGCSPNPNDARISWWQNLHLQIIAEQRILQC
jgi:hypothetical protein